MQTLGRVRNAVRQCQMLATTACCQATETYSISQCACVTRRDGPERCMPVLVELVWTHASTDGYREIDRNCTGRQWKLTKLLI